MAKTFTIATQVVVLLAVAAAFSLAGPPATPDNSPSAAEIKAPLDKVPKAVFPRLTYEFDPVYEGTEITHDFVVENSGEAPLVIKSIRPD